MKDMSLTLRNALLYGTLFALAGWSGSRAQAADWPTHRGNSQRNAVMEECLALPLSPAWVYEPRYAPEPAWPPPARQDFWHGEWDLAPRVDFDRAYHVAVAGDSLFYGSPADHAVYCLNTRTGSVRWTFHTEGPVRFAPVVRHDKVYFGSDDGNVYCLTADVGNLVWKYHPSAVDRRLPGNGHMISMWPVRTGLVIENDTLYAGAGLFPNQGVYLFALDADTGEEVWKANDLPTRPGIPCCRCRDPVGPQWPHGIPGRPPSGWQGTRLARYLRHLPGDHARVRVLRKQSLPAAPPDPRRRGEHGPFRRRQGRKPPISRARGLSPHGPWPLTSELATELGKQRSRHKKLADKLKRTGNHDTALKEEVNALRKSIADLDDEMENKCHLWRRKDSPAYSFLLAGDTLFCGRDGRVTAAQTSDGAEAWSAEVDGRAYGLAVAQGRLFVSTDVGRIYCFQPGTVAASKSSNASEA